MKIIDKAKGFYEDHKDQIMATAIGFACAGTAFTLLCIGATSGVGMANHAILTEIARNPGMLLTDFAKKYDL